MLRVPPSSLPAGQVSLPKQDPREVDEHVAAAKGRLGLPQVRRSSLEVAVERVEPTEQPMTVSGVVPPPVLVTDL
ncbi:MAG: hypothetical protein ACRDYA_23745 [Egibacteraceae bacterium]